MAGPSGNETNHRIDGLTVSGGLALEGAGGVLTYLNRDVSAYTARQISLLRGTGIFAENFPRASSGAASPCTAGVIHGCGIGLLTGDVVTNIVVLNNVAGVTLGLTKVGVYSRTGVLLGSSADVNATFLSTGVKVVPLTTPLTIPSDDLYYLVILVVTASTMIQPIRGHAANNAAGAIGSNATLTVQMTAQTDLPATMTVVGSSASIAFWFGVS